MQVRVVTWMGPAVAPVDPMAVMKVSDTTVKVVCGVSLKVTEVLPVSPVPRIWTGELARRIETVPPGIGYRQADLSVAVQVCRHDLRGINAGVAGCVGHGNEAGSGNLKVLDVGGSTAWGRTN